MISQSIHTKEKANGEKGMFAIKYIKKGDLVWKLDPSENILSKMEKEKLPPKIRKFAFQFKNGFIVVHDASQFMNHSCDPNTWWTADDELSALKDINIGEEVTYDYSTADVGDWVAGWKCNCSSDICRHQITGRDCLDAEFQKRFKKHLPSWTKKFIRNNLLINHYQ